MTIEDESPIHVAEGGDILFELITIELMVLKGINEHFPLIQNPGARGQRIVWMHPCGFAV
jgi:hypothetical protein